jgi:hypothetical protein
MDFALLVRSAFFAPGRVTSDNPIIVGAGFGKTGVMESRTPGPV